MNWESTNPASTKESYLTELEKLLQVLPEEEREEALTYYTEYFDDAGADQVERVLRELGPAEKLAAQISSGYGRNYLDAEPHSSSERVPARPEDAAQARAQAEADQAAAERARQQKEADERTRAEDARRAQAETRQQERAGGRSNGTSLLLIALIIVTVPIWLPVLVTVFGLTVAFFGVLVALLVASVAMTIGFLIGGIALSISGIPMLFIGFWDGLITLSSGLILIGLALLAILLAYLVCFRLFPAAVRLLVRALQWPLQRRRGGAQA